MRDERPTAHGPRPVALCRQPLALQRGRSSGQRRRFAPVAGVALDVGPSRWTPGSGGQGWVVDMPGGAKRDKGKKEKKEHKHKARGQVPTATCHMPHAKCQMASPRGPPPSPITAGTRARGQGPGTRGQGARGGEGWGERGEG